MRLTARVAALGLLAVAGCSSPPAGSSQVTLNDPYWDKVNVEVVMTKSSICDKRDAYISSKELVMHKNKTETFDVPDGAIMCWRHDPNPNNPVAGAWSGWTKATPVSGQSASTDL
ncbi:MAG TPA: hypothetical protein VHY35_09535 [Stellaceae bacterium]|jgi:hypothetical protein|nr:hypothetical protein [Stellaceae bacterium]